METCNKNWRKICSRSTGYSEEWDNFQHADEFLKSDSCKVRYIEGLKNFAKGFVFKSYRYCVVRDDKNT